jgi:hypothetical protein
MIYVLCPRPSSGARELVAWLRANGSEARKVRRIPALHVGDLLVNWGVSGIDATTLDRADVLNPNVCTNKYHQLEALADAGVPVPEHRRTRPESMQGWLARRFYHREASDLLAELDHGDYYVWFIPVEREFRIHIFKGKSIRAGMKVPRTTTPHPNFRSWAAGWKLSYGSDCQSYMRQSFRNTARRAVEALGLDFGAVDLAVRANGDIVVWEVNTAPGLEGGTIAAYGRHIQEVDRNATT